MANSVFEDLQRRTIALTEEQQSRMRDLLQSGLAADAAGKIPTALREALLSTQSSQSKEDLVDFEAACDEFWEIFWLGESVAPTDDHARQAWVHRRRRSLAMAMQNWADLAAAALAEDDLNQIRTLSDWWVQDPVDFSEFVELLEREPESVDRAYLVGTFLVRHSSPTSFEAKSVGVDVCRSLLHVYEQSGDSGGVAYCCLSIAYGDLTVAANSCAKAFRLCEDNEDVRETLDSVALQELESLTFEAAERLKRARACLERPELKEEAANHADASIWTDDLRANLQSLIEAERMARALWEDYRGSVSGR